MPQATLNELNQRFALPDRLRFDAGRGGLLRAVVTHPAATGEMYLHGGHVTGWQPTGRQPVLFMSDASYFVPDMPIRGGVPVCFPWFGPKADDPQAPAHGLARTRPWNVTAAELLNEGVRIAMAVVVEPFLVTHRVTFGPTLRMALHVENTGGAPATFEEALHTYLRVGGVHQIKITGLEGAEYLDRMAGGERRRQGDEPIRFTEETDRVYLDTTATCELTDPAMTRRIRVAKEGSRDTVVWNPWIAKAARMPDFGDNEWPDMVCIETANVGDNAVTLAPGEGHEMTAEISVE